MKIPVGSVLKYIDGEQTAEVTGRKKGGPREGDVTDGSDNQAARHRLQRKTGTLLDVQRMRRHRDLHNQTYGEMG